jgi:hypothetical protein
MDPNGIGCDSIDIIWLRKGTHGTCELGNGFSGSRGVENFLTTHELPAYEDGLCSL